MAKIGRGSNILAISLKDVSERIEQHPWIEKAQVKRMLPRRIFIEVIERRPIAMINLDRLYMVDKKGVVFKEVGPEDVSDIPVLTGLESEGFADNESVSKNLIENALTLMKKVDKDKALCLDDISEIHMDPYCGLTLYTLNDAIQIKLGFGPYEQKLVRLKKVMADLQTKYRNAECIDMTYGQKVYVKLEKKESSQILVALRERKER